MLIGKKGIYACSGVGSFLFNIVLHQILEICEPPPFGRFFGDFSRLCYTQGKYSAKKC